jgi:hypothetical protein
MNVDAKPADGRKMASRGVLRVLQTAFVTAFANRLSFGALVAFLVTVADVPSLNVAAAFGDGPPASSYPSCWSGQRLGRSRPRKVDVASHFGILPKAEIRRNARQGLLSRLERT